MKKVLIVLAFLIVRLFRRRNWSKVAEMIWVMAFIFYIDNIDNRVMDPELGEIIYPYEEERGHVFLPSFHFGLKIGIAKKVCINDE